MPDAATATAALRASHDRLRGLLDPLSAAELGRQSYDDDWSIAQVASHLGSQAEIFGLFLEAGINGAPAPAGDQFPPIWARWDGASATDQAAESIRHNAAFLDRVESLPDETVKSWHLDMFGGSYDLAGLIGLRVSEHAVHTWDVAVALDPSAVIAPDAVTLLIDSVAAVAGRGTVIDHPDVRIATTDPARQFRLTLTPEISLTEVDDDADAGLTLPAEALIRLVFGRLDPAHTPAGITGAEHLAALRTAFPGF